MPRLAIDFAHLTVDAFQKKKLWCCVVLTLHSLNDGFLTKLIKTGV